MVCRRCKKDKTKFEFKIASSKICNYCKENDPDWQEFKNLKERAERQEEKINEMLQIFTQVDIAYTEKDKKKLFDVVILIKAFLSKQRRVAKYRQSLKA